MRVKMFGFMSIVMAFAVLPVLAHHSHAMYDSSKTEAVTGTVISFQWTNPHSWLDVAVKDETGQEEKFSFEMSSPNSLAREGLKPKSILPGDEVIVNYHPLKDGKPGGEFLGAQFAKGLTVGDSVQTSPPGPAGGY